MTSQKTARQSLGDSIRFYREQRGLDQARVADITKVSRSEVNDWECGHSVPDGKAWELLKKMVHRGLAQIGDVRQRALSELDAERALRSREKQRATKPATEVAPLTSRPFEVLAETPILSLVKESPEPDLKTKQDAVVPQDVPATLLGENYDLTDAYISVRSLPEGWNTMGAKKERAAYAKDLLSKNTDVEEVIEKTREKFGVGISRSTLQRLQTELNRQTKREAAKAAKVTALSPSSLPVPEAGAVSEKDIEAAAQIVLDAIPNLKTFTLSVDENGDVTVSHTVREVRVVESTRSTKIKR